MKSKAHIYSIPAVIALCALVVGLTGICLAGAWKMLLVLSAGVALSEMHVMADFVQALKVGSPEFKKTSAGLTSRFKVAFDMPKFVRWIDSVMRSMIEYLALVGVTMLMERFSASSPLPLWAAIAFLIGCVKMPWCYRGSADDRKFRAWVLLASAFFTGGLWMWLGRIDFAAAGNVGFGLILVNCVRTAIVERRRA